MGGGRVILESVLWSVLDYYAWKYSREGFFCLFVVVDFWGGGALRSGMVSGQG